jgi:hypothetical protein
MREVDLYLVAQAAGVELHVASDALIRVIARHGRRGIYLGDGPSEHTTHATPKVTIHGAALVRTELALTS